MTAPAGARFTLQCAGHQLAHTSSAVVAAVCKLVGVNILLLRAGQRAHVPFFIPMIQM